MGDQGGLVRLSVGGQPFLASKATLTAHTGVLSAMFDGRMQAGARTCDDTVFIDR